jgi:hypothetical protein
VSAASAELLKRDADADMQFREYLEANGYDVSQLGIGGNDSFKESVDDNNEKVSTA